jgi:hypothetical protein
MECGALFDLLNALSHVSPKRVSRREAFADTAWSHAFQAMPSASVTPPPGTFTFTFTSTFTIGHYRVLPTRFRDDPFN